jgi:hypothetical protein
VKVRDIVSGIHVGCGNDRLTLSESGTFRDPGMNLDLLATMNSDGITPEG